MTVPNKSMIDKPLNNLSLRTFRRVQFDLNLTYDTTSQQIMAITSELQEYIDNLPQTNQDGRIRFQNLGASSKDVMVLYFVEALGWNEFINIKEEAAYKIVEVVEKHGTDFAFPTQTLQVYRESKEPAQKSPETGHFPSTGIQEGINKKAGEAPAFFSPLLFLICCPGFIAPLSPPDITL